MIYLPKPARLRNKPNNMNIIKPLIIIVIMLNIITYKYNYFNNNVHNLKK